MEKKKFEVKIYFSSFCSYEIEAENKADSIIHARKISVNKNEILTNLENWKEADTSTEIEYKKIKNQNPF